MGNGTKASQKRGSGLPNLPFTAISLDMAGSHGPPSLHHPGKHHGPEHTRVNKLQ